MVKFYGKFGENKGNLRSIIRDGVPLVIDSNGFLVDDEGSVPVVNSHVRFIPARRNDDECTPRPATRAVGIARARTQKAGEHRDQA